jgi:23S rRNA pseudouridine1911/1915/1917 synthase
MKYKVETESSILDALAHFFPDCSKSTLRSWLEHRRVEIQGRKITRASDIVHPKDEIEVLPKPLPKEGPLKICYEDEHVIVIDKPAGLLSVAKDTGNEVSAHDFVKQHFPGQKVFVIHRLDQETSGLMMFTLTQEAFRILKDDLKRREVQRKYTALVEGLLEGSGTWDCYLVEDRSLKMKVVQEGVEGAERAITNYTVLKPGKNSTLIECSLVTGKKNQIRVHANLVGHPIVGDKKYGSKETLASRLCLHATSLSFCHPITGKKLVFTSPFPRFLLRQQHLQ